MSEIHDLFEACKKGNLTEVKECLSDLCSYSPTGFAHAIMLATMSGHLEVVTYLDSYEVRQKFNNSPNYHALSSASSNGHLDIAKYFMEQTVYKIPEDKILQAIASAIKYRKIDVMIYLLEGNFCDINGKKGILLTLACEVGSLKMVQFLLSSPTLKIHILPEYVNSAFIKACEHGHMDIVNYFAENYVIDAKSLNSEAFHRACSHNHLNVIDFLLHSEKLIGNAQIKDINEYLIHDICFHGHLQTLQYIFGLAPNIHIKAHKTLFKRILRGGNLYILQDMLEHQKLIIDDSMKNWLNHYYNDKKYQNAISKLGALKTIEYYELLNKIPEKSENTSLRKI